MSAALGAPGRFAPKILTAWFAAPVFSAATLAPSTTASLLRRVSFTSMPVSSYAPVNQRPHICVQSRSTNITSRHGSLVAAAPRPRHW